MATKFDELLEEQKQSTNKFNKIRIKLLELKYMRLKDKALLDATKAAFETQIYDINKECFDAKRDKKKLETSKLFMFFIVLNCTIIEAYSMWVMIHFADLSSLSTLMAAVIAESVSFAVYCAKAYFGKKGEVDAELERENMQFEREKLLMESLPEDTSEEEFFDDDLVSDDSGTVG